jgi:hypothetical protein
VKGKVARKATQVRCPLWVKSRHLKSQCPLYPRNRISKVRVGMSANCPEADIAKLPEFLRKPVIRSVELIVQPGANDVVSEMGVRVDLSAP